MSGEKTIESQDSSELSNAQLDKAAGGGLNFGTIEWVYTQQKRTDGTVSGTSTTPSTTSGK